MDGILDRVLQRLASFGCTAPDEWAVQFCIEKVENHIKNQINRTEIPAELAEVLTDRACGEYLQSAYAAGQAGAGKPRPDKRCPVGERG